MGLSVSDAFRILMRRVAAEQTFPLELKVPNAKTQASIEELEAGNGIKTDSIQALLKELNAQA